MLITTTWTGAEANNRMYALDSGGNEGGLLVNTTGSYSGSTLLNLSDDETAALKVEGNGRWKIRIEPTSKAHRWDGKGTFEGKSDDVVHVQGVFTGRDKLSFESTKAEGRTTIHGIRNKGSKRIINAVGVFSWKYSVPAGVILFHVRSDGQWTLTKS